MTTVEKLERITFGIFEVDLQAGELWKAGFRVRLAGQPFKVLVALLERPGEVVSREELQAQIWKSNTNVDFERAISGTINKIREALGDSAENPRFVETLPKRGYRFIAPVRSVLVERPEPAGLPSSLQVSPLFVASEAVTAQIQLPSADVPAVLVSEAPKKIESARPGRLHEWSLRETLLALGLLVALAVLLVRWAVQLPSSTVTSPPRVTQVSHFVPISVGPPNAESFLTLAIEGDRILAPVLVNGRSRQFAIFASTGEAQPIPMPDDLASATLADISPDGARLLLRSHLSSVSEQPLWTAPSSGGSGQRVGSVLAHDATWMPDGTGILYANEDELTLYKQEDGSSTPYARLPGRAFWLRWSPDGKLLRFTLMNPVTHTTSLWELNPASHVQGPIANAQAAHLAACCGVWAANGNAFVFQAEDNLWELQGRGRQQRLLQLTNGPLRYLSPAAASTGNRIFFVGLDAHFGAQEFVEKTHRFEAVPAFLADANRIEYTRDHAWVAWTDANEVLWRARADGSDKIRLSSNALEVFMAHWSPDGKRLAMMAREQDGLWQTYLVDAVGGKPEALLRETRNSADPSWSADGRRLVYGRQPELMGKESGPRTLQIMDLVTHQTEEIPNSEGLFSPRWSPDGAWIAALTLDQRSLMLYNISARRWHPLASTSAADPVWSSDSKAVYVHAFQADREPILKIAVPDGSVQIVADLGDLRDRETANYFFGGLTPDDQPIVQPRVGTGSLYSLELPSRE